MRKIIIDKEELQKYYVDENHTLKECAAHFNCGYSTIAARVKELEIVKPTASVVERRKQTCLNKYGVENPSQAESIKEKKRQTTLSNYGVENPMQSQEVKQKLEKTMLDKYGVRNIFELKHGAPDGASLEI